MAHFSSWNRGVKTVKVSGEVYSSDVSVAYLDLTTGDGDEITIHRVSAECVDDMVRQLLEYRNRLWPADEQAQQEQAQQATEQAVSDMS